MSDIITKLKNAHPYIYMINGSYYCIGSSVFYECSNEEKEAFDNLMNTFNDLVHLEYDIEDRDTIKLCQQYLSIFGRRKDHAYDSDKERKANNKIAELFSQLNETAIVDFKNQMDDRERILNCVDRFRLNNNL